MKIAIMPNPTRQEALECAEEIRKILQNAGCEILLKSDLFDEKGSFRDQADPVLRSCDLFLAVGGDGTIIHTAKLAAVADRPILGVNAGNLGFTAGLERNELSLLPGLLQGAYREERRMMLSVELIRNQEQHGFLALNDAVVSGETASIVHYQMALGENSGYACRADGFIVATPTGSTAYSLSAGGPVIQPDMDCLVYTPVCSHSLFSRSVVFGGDTRLLVTIPENRSSLYLTVDGEQPVKLKTGDRLLFFRAAQPVRFWRLGKRDFYDAINQKIALVQ